MIEDFSNFKTKNKFALKLKNKIKGIVYTPKHIVINMLDMLNYSNKHILNKRYGSIPMLSITNHFSK